MNLSPYFKEIEKCIDSLKELSDREPISQPVQDLTDYLVCELETLKEYLDEETKS